MAFEVITWTIVGAFIITTIVTILGITNVITIQSNYLGRLFAALILEIIACGFLIFRNGPTWSPEQEYFKQASSLFQSALTSRAANDASLAEDKLRSIVRLEVPDLPVEVPSVFKELGDLYFKRDDWFGASHTLAIYYEMKPDDFQAALQYGTSLQHLSQYDKSLPIFETLSIKNGSNPDVFYGLVNIYRRKGSFSKFAKMTDASNDEFKTALRYADRVVKILESNKETEAYAKALVTRANIYWQMEKKQVALQQLSSIASSYPKYVKASEHLAALRLEIAQDAGRSADIAVPRDAFAELYRNRPKDSDIAFNGSGFAEAAALTPGTPAELLTAARDAALEAIAIRPDDPYCSYAAALVFYAAGDHNGAKKYLDDAVRLERARAINPYAFDYVRLARYEALQTTWASTDR